MVKTILLTKHLILVLLLVISFSAQAKFKVAALTTRDHDDMFWEPLISFMKEAANDLDIELVEGHAKNSFFIMHEIVDRLTKSGIDAIIIPNFRGNTERLVRLCNSRKVPVFVYNTKTMGMGVPRDRYPYWIGGIHPDDERGGARLLKHLAKSWLKSRKIGKLDVLAFEGNIRSVSSLERRSGLLNEVNKHKNMTLLQLTNGDWSPKLTSEKFVKLKKNRHKSAQIIWAASDGMALGVVDGARKLGLTPGKDFVTGGFDTTKEGLEAIKKGEIEASLGGHFMEGAWALVLIHDYLRGKDFNSEQLVFKTRLSLATKDNLHLFYRMLDRENWKKIDFKKFSKVHNPNLKRYDFSLKRFFQQL